MTPRTFIEAARDIFAQNQTSDHRRASNLELTADMIEYIERTDYKRNSAFDQLRTVLDNFSETASTADDANEYSDLFYEYLNELSGMEGDLVEDEWVMQGNLSSNLRALFGLADNLHSDDSSMQDWTPPSFAGLGNSEPIVNINRRLAESKSYDDTRDILSNSYDEKAQDKYSRILNTDSSKSVPISPKYKAESKDDIGYKLEESDTEDDELDSDDDTEMDNSDDGSDISFSKMNMSTNLMKALGLGTDDIDDSTDWTPPAFSGVNNSSKLV